LRDIPELVTPRLILRAHVPDDLDACFAMWAEPAVYKHTMGKPGTREEVWSRLQRYHGHWHWFGYGFWAITDRASGRFIGEAGFADFKRDMDPPLGDRPEMGWILTTEMHRKGIGSEAVEAAAAWGDANLPVKKTACIIEPTNAASIRVAGKAGFKQICMTVHRGEEVLLFHRG
jgi:RimJ/RimL family protein N-acetyltransferase